VRDDDEYLDLYGGNKQRGFTEFQSTAGFTEWRDMHTALISDVFLQFPHFG
jgi:hypothetical protein